MRTAWLECATGLSGDMTLAAMIDAGADVNFRENDDCWSVLMGASAHCTSSSNIGTIELLISAPASINNFTVSFVLVVLECTDASIRAVQCRSVIELS